MKLFAIIVALAIANVLAGESDEYKGKYDNKDLNKEYKGYMQSWKGDDSKGNDWKDVYGSKEWQEQMKKIEEEKKKMEDMKKKMEEEKKKMEEEKKKMEEEKKKMEEKKMEEDKKKKEEKKMEEKKTEDMKKKMEEEKKKMEEKKWEDRMGSDKYEGKYTDKYDSMDLDAVIGNKRLMQAYSKCMLDQGKCTAEGKELKSHISEALQNGCAKCTETQQKGMKKVIKYYMEKEPETWEQLCDKYDPKRTYSKKYEKELMSMKH